MYPRDSLLTSVRRTPVSRPPHGADPLDGGGFRLPEDHVLVGDDPEATPDQVQQLAVAQEEVGVHWTAREGLVAFGEGLIDEHAPRRHRANQGVQQGPVEVVGDDNPAEGTPRKRKEVCALEVSLDGCHQGVASEVTQVGEVDVDGRDGMTRLGEQAGVAAPAAGQVEHRRTFGDHRGEAQNPRRGAQGAPQGAG